MTDAPEAEILEIAELELAPAERTPKATRESFIKPPDWRYQEAVAFIESKRKGSFAPIPTDPIVQLTIRALEGLRSEHTRQYVEELWPDLYEALVLGTVAHNSSLAAEIEAHIIAGDSAWSIGAGIFGLRSQTYVLYRDIFFDLSGIQAVHSWIEYHLFEPARAAGKRTILRSRMMAYYGNKELAKRAAVTGGVDDQCINMMRKLIRGERMRRVFDYMTTHTSLSSEQYAEVMESTLKVMNDQEFQEHMRDRTEAGSTTLAEFAEHLEEGIRAYSQQELKQTDESGLDFVNQYTATILNKETTDGNK